MLQQKEFAALFVWLSLLFVSNALLENAEKSKVGTKQNPGKSCKDILARGETLSKTYYIRLGGEVLHVYCDQTTAGGGWTLVLSYTFTHFNHFGEEMNAITPHPNWPVESDTFTSVTPPLNETDFNAMSFFLWRQIGTEFMIKSNINNWVACSEKTGSLVKFIDGSISCKLVKNVAGKCKNVVPNTLLTRIPTGTGGPVFYNKDSRTARFKAYYYLEALTKFAYPTHDPCGRDNDHPFTKPSIPHGNIYIR